MEKGKNEEILNKIRKIEEEIKKLQEEINALYEQLSPEDDINYIFEWLKRITQEQFYTIIYYTNSTVKYVTQKPESGFGVIIITSNTSDKKGYVGYVFEDYSFNENIIEIRFYEKYDIPDEIINILNTVQESNIDYAVASLFQLYYLMKKYPVSFVKVKYD